MIRDALLIVDKPARITSAGAVAAVKRALGELWGRPPARIGHGGTLDPAATGVLPVAFGEATKCAAFLLEADKEYLADVALGVTTDTLDADGAVLERRDPAGVSAAALDAALAGLRGRLRQIPPMHSALKRAGRPLYELARAGLEVERAPREVTIHELALLEAAPGRLRLRVRCSKGTYVRVLAADLGARLGCGAHLAALRRTRSGPFGLEDALPLDGLAAALRSGGARLFTPAEALAHLPAIALPADLAAGVRQGRRPPLASLGGQAPPKGGPLRLLDPDGRLAAVAEAPPGAGLRLLRVFAAPPEIH